MRIAAAMVCALALSCSDAKPGGSSDDRAPAGKVLAVTGTATAQLASDPPRPLASGDVVMTGDTLRTEADSSLRLRLDHNNAVLDLGAGKTVAVKASAAWRASRVAAGALDEKVEDGTAVAGRQSEKNAADTASTALHEGTMGDEDTEPAAESEPMLADPTPEPTTSRPPKTKPKRDPKPDKTSPNTSKPRPSACDEVGCVLEPDRACCRTFDKRKPEASSGGSAAPPASLRPTEVKKAIAKVKARVESCGPGTGDAVPVKTTIIISPTGQVTSATLIGASKDVEACVFRELRKARFPKTVKGGKVTYPFRLRL